MEKGYIVIFEDGNVKRTDFISEEMFDASDDGLLDIIRIDGPLPMVYNQNVWEPVESL